MLENEFDHQRQRNPLTSLVIVLAVVILGFAVVGPVVGYLVSLPFYSGSFMDLANDIQDPLGHPELKLPLFIIQGFATFVGLILGPAWFLTTERRSIADFFDKRNTTLAAVLMTALIVVLFMGVNAFFIEWNSKFVFPEFAKGFEEWAREREDLAAALTEFLTKFDTIAEVTIAMVVIAILPAFGEELVFRGLIQNQLFQATRNIHVSIWVAAFLFSAIHMQFFGFVPRLLLGALFGYLYYWSGNLWLAVIAHFVNNGFSVLAMYFYQRGAIDLDVEKVDAVPANVVITSGLLTIGLLYYFYKYFENRKPHKDYL